MDRRLERAATVSVPDRVAGTGMLVALVSLVVFAKSSLIGFCLLVFTIAAVAGFERMSLVGSLSATRAEALLATFVGWCLVTCLWAPDVAMALAAIATVAVGLLATRLVISWINHQTPCRLGHLAFWLLIGYIAGISLLLLLLALKQEPLAWIVTKLGLFEAGETTTLIKQDKGHIVVQRAILNTSVAAASMLLPTMLLIAWFKTRGRLRVGLVLVIGVIGATTVAASAHESSKIALLIAPLVFGIGLWRARVAKYLVAVLWTCVVLAIQPAALVAFHSLELHKASWLQPSAQHRIGIWADYTERSRDHLLLGAGVRASKHLSEVEAPARLVWREGAVTTVSRHPHSAFLQIAFETGVVGSLLVLAAGLLYVFSIGGVGTAAQLTVFTIAATILSLCWDLWQAWQLAMYALVAIFTAVAVRFAERVPRERGP